MEAAETGLPVALSAAAAEAAETEPVVGLEPGNSGRMADEKVEVEVDGEPGLLSKPVGIPLQMAGCLPPAERTVSGCLNQGNFVVLVRFDSSGLRNFITYAQTGFQSINKYRYQLSI